VTPKTKTHICHAIVKSTITNVAETWCLKVKTVAKLNSKKKWNFGDAQLEFPGMTKLGILLLNKMNAVRSLLDDIKPKQLQWYGHVQRMEEGRLPKEVMKWSQPGRRKRGRPKLMSGRD